MELTDLAKPLENKVKPVPFDQFQKSADWMVPRGRFYYMPMGNFVKGMISTYLGGGVPILDYTGRLCSKGVPF